MTIIIKSLPEKASLSTIPPEINYSALSSKGEDRSRVLDMVAQEAENEAKYNLVPSADAALLYGGAVASVASINNAADIQNGVQLQPAPTSNWSTSLQTVLDNPPASLPNQMILGGMLFCTVFGAWANFAHLDEVGKATGRLVPQGEPYKIHPVVSGKIAHVYVQEGQVIKAGQVIAEMDNQIAHQEIERLEQEHTALQTQLIQAQALVDKTRLEARMRIEVAQAEQQAQASAIAETQAKLAAKGQLISQLQNQQGANIQRHEQLEPLLAKSKELLKQRQSEVAAYQARVERLRPLLEEGAISRELIFEAEQAVRDRKAAITKSQLEETPLTRDRLFEAEQAEAQTARAITQSQGEIQQIATEVKRLQAELVQKQAEASTIQVQAQQKVQQMQMERTQLQAKIQEDQKRLEKAKAELKQLYLTAPVDGVVLSLNIHNSGEFVQPGQTIAQMASQNAPLILQAILPNREAGFVKVGKTAQIKFDAYPYQDYGIVTGKVISISPDAKPNEQLGAVYGVEIELDRNYVAANNQNIKFKPGQTANAEIIIRQRRIVDVLLDPIRQIQKGGINL
jgi:hemolysin D